MIISNGQIICEQCGRTTPLRNTEHILGAAKDAVLNHGWGYVWEHIDEFDHVAHFYCARCKAEFDDTVTATDIPQ